MAGWPAMGGTWAISRRSTHRSVIAHLIGRWRKRNDDATGCGGAMPQGGSQKYFTIHCEHRIFRARLGGFQADNAQPEGWYRQPLNRTCQWRITFAKIGSTPTIPISLNGGFFPWLWQLATPPRISKPKRPKAKSASTTGSATIGWCCFRTRRISPRFAPPSSAPWRG